MSIHLKYQQIVLLLCSFFLQSGCFETELSKTIEHYNQGTTHSKIVLIRHGESVANAERKFSWAEVPLTAQGYRQAQYAASIVQSHNIAFDCAYTSGLKRAQDTLTVILRALDCQGIPTKEAAELNTRSFGDLGRWTKDQACARFGEHQVKLWYGIEYENVADVAPPGGETLRYCENRAQSYYMNEIKNKVLAGKNILVAISRNPIYSLMKQIEGSQLKPVPIEEMKNALPIIYELDSRGKVLRRTMYK
ncbi:hypothetical protein PGT21_032673 [Puccinia graminis f. sp. tritici]|uniref:Phosphoglycerate mutase n=1 Tax=Puccinia graminis f. sp. tritici TaxID=56615 RepID=A0A5B0QC86_PUCGR|nr:hypothetical protein PGT21_032673 [Puccinia graminis f. sp. tritici]